MSATNIDWARIAERFDLWLPHLAPVTEIMLQAFDLAPGTQVLDLATGTGEPAIPLKQRYPGVNLVAVDSQPAMVEFAARKARNIGVEGIHFMAMPAEQLELPDRVFDVVLCRFGLMLFDDPPAAVAEAMRVLKPGGRLLAAVWGEGEQMQTLDWFLRAFDDRLEPEYTAGLRRITSLGEPGALVGLMDAIGFEEIEIRDQVFSYQLADFAEYWSLVERSSTLDAQFDLLSEEQLADVKSEVAACAQAFTSDAGLVVPHGFLLASAQSPA